jgi:hypothetical protein
VSPRCRKQARDSEAKFIRAQLWIHRYTTRIVDHARVLTACISIIAALLELRDEVRRIRS